MPSESAMRLGLIAVGLSCLMATAPLAAGSSSAWAQEETTAEAEDEDIADLLASITGMANELEGSLGDLEERIQASRESAEQGAEVLDLMSSALENVHDRLERDSEIWQELDAMLQQWEDDMAAAQARAASDPRWQARADAWGERIQTGVEIRRQLGEQAVEANSLIRHISGERELILEDYRLGEAQRAVDAMADVGNQMTAFTGAMRQLADRTQNVVADATEEVPQ